MTLDDRDLKLLVDALVDPLADAVAARLSAFESDATTAGSLLTTDEACNRLNVARSTIYDLRSRGAISAVTIGRAVRFRSEDVERLRREGTS